MSYKNILPIETVYEIGSITYSVSGSGQNEVNERAYRTADFIPINPNLQYKLYTDKLDNTFARAPYYYFYYDANKNYVARADKELFEPPSNARYIRFYEHIGSVLTVDQVKGARCMMFDSKSAPPYSANMEYIPPAGVKPSIPNANASLIDLANKVSQISDYTDVIRCDLINECNEIIDLL